MHYILLVLIGFLLGIFAAKISFFFFLTAKVAGIGALIVALIITAIIIRIKYRSK